MQMEENGLIKRRASPNGLTLELDTKGRELLKDNYQQLKAIFSDKKTEIIGKVQKGIGEGAYYVSQKQYQQQFKDKLGFIAFAGTLNLRVDKEELAKFLANRNQVEISGFTTKSRSFGRLVCYKVRINDMEAAIVIPERARHAEDIVEIIAQTSLREALRLDDQKKVKLS